MRINAVRVSIGDTAHVRVLTPPIEFDAQDVYGFRMEVDPDGDIVIALDALSTDPVD